MLLHSWQLLCVTVLIYSNSCMALNVSEVKNTTNAIIPASPAPILQVPSTTRKPLLQGIRLPCACAAGQCGCCTGYVLDRFNQKACVNVTYEPDDFAITAAMMLNGKVLYKNTVSGKNPPPMCIRIPRLQVVELCVEFSNIYFANNNMHMCIDAEANWEDVTLIDWSFDCVRMGISGVAVVSPADGGGTPGNPPDSEDQTDEDYDDSAKNAPLFPDHHRKKESKIIFSSNLRKAAESVPNRNLINVRKLETEDYLVSFVG